METMEMPMTSGVAIATSSFDETEFVTASESVAVSEIASSDIPRNDDMEATTADVDTLLKQAKDEGDGFEDILEKISEGEFTTGEEPQPEEVEAAEPEEIETSEDELDTLSPEDEIELIEKVVVLEDKVDQLLNETKQLSEKLDKITGERGGMSKEEFFEMIMLLYKMMKEEESEKKKVSFLEFMIKLIGIFMQSIADPEVLEKAQENNKQEKVSEEPSSISSMIEYLEKNGGFKKSKPQMEMPREALLSSDTIAA